MCKFSARANGDVFAHGNPDKTLDYTGVGEWCAISQLGRAFQRGFPDFHRFCMAFRPKATKSRIRGEHHLHYSRCTRYKNSQWINLGMENCRAAMIDCSVSLASFHGFQAAGSSFS
jgi:hypothetical protein